MEENKQRLQEVKEEKSVDKMSFKELQTECVRLREIVQDKDGLIAELSKKLEIRSKFADHESIDIVAVKKEANEIRKKAMEQAQSILDEAKSAASKMMGCVKGTVEPFTDMRHTSELELPGADADLGLGDLLLTSDGYANTYINEDGKTSEEDSEYALSPHERIFHDYFNK